jgi:hypothetical protein
MTVILLPFLAIAAVIGALVVIGIVVAVVYASREARGGK